ncbi:hypothetical protein [Methylobacterium platani]|uniref:hypothetical protein n=1 Tax=Methylobacterium platani TaxID=427683 RepID=UPI000A4367CD|nr:hypothetical protein [Methylobacterium platani]
MDTPLATPPETGTSVAPAAAPGGASRPEADPDAVRRALANSEGRLRSLLAAGGPRDSYRSDARAREFLPAVAASLKLDPDTQALVEDDLVSFIQDVILGIAWYTGKYKDAEKAAKWYIAANAAVVVAVPGAITLIGSHLVAGAASPYGVVIAQLSSILSGTFALQKTVSAWYSQQRNYAAWYKCSSDLKEIYYNLIRDWSGKAKGGENAFVGSLALGQETARKIMQAERLDFYTRLALPSFDVLDMLTASKDKAATLVTSLVPEAKEVKAIAIGMKAIQGASLAPKAPEAAAPAPVSRLADQPGIRTSTLVAAMKPLAAASLQGGVPDLLAAQGLPAFDQAVVDACASLTLKGSADILSLFGGYHGFYDWFNATFHDVPDVAQRHPSPDTALKRKNFSDFWDQIQVVFGKDSINALEFSALMAVNLEESRGNLSASPEEMNGMDHPHPGLAYAFDRIPGLKQSYNLPNDRQNPPNRTALALFQDPDFLRAHKDRAGSASVLERSGGIDPRWGGDIWPSDVPAWVDPARNGFIMQADFYKFRGRGVIQTTWRSDYRSLIEWALKVSKDQNAVIASVADRWRSDTRTGAGQIDEIATISSNEDWDRIFGEALALAQGVRIDSRDKGDYLNTLSADAAVLDAGRRVPGSFLNFAAHINGGDYPDRVAPMMKALACGIARTVGAQVASRQPRSPTLPV